MCKTNLKELLFFKKKLFKAKETWAVWAALGGELGYFLVSHTALLVLNPLYPKTALTQNKMPTPVALKKKTWENSIRDVSHRASPQTCSHSMEMNPSKFCEYNNCYTISYNI